MKILTALVSACLLVLAAQSARAQGCVAVRPMSCGGAAAGNAAMLGKGAFQASANYRYFRSFRHFRSDSEQEERVELGTEVVNIANSADLSLAFGLTDRLSVAANLPVIHYDRSSLYEHYGNSTTANPEQKRFHTGAKGIGDLRLSATYWLLDPHRAARRNLAVGLGLKLPTGNSTVQGEFHKRKATDGTDSIVVKAVDQSIQLGDGGVGISLELQGYAALGSRFSAYFNGFYMSNPRETNNAVNRVLSASSSARDSIVGFHSVADQYAVRFGLGCAVFPKMGISASLGARMEGIPAHDLIGGSNGFRRPGYVVSVEPGVAVQRGSLSLALNVPIALYRNRVKSVFDLSDPSGAAHGDAAFADYLISVSAAYRFGGKHHDMMPPVPAFPDAKRQ